MSFSVEQALRICTSNLAQRKKTRGATYFLYFTNQPNCTEGKLIGNTIKTLTEEFRSYGRSYKYAFIVKEGEEEKVLRFYNRDQSKKFFSMTRTGIKRKK